MKLAKALTALKIARSGSEAQRLIKQGAVLVGGCIPPCNGRMPPYKCTCNGWRKVTSPTEDIPAGQVVRISDGNWRLMNRLDNTSGFDQVPGIGWVPEDESPAPTE
jgi:predicted rRNA methylase YqxC with S4 and FtsJ domains